MKEGATLQRLRQVASEPSKYATCIPTDTIVPIPIIALATMPLDAPRLEILKYMLVAVEDGSPFGTARTLCPAGFPAFHWAAVSLGLEDVKTWLELVPDPKVKGRK